MLIILSGLPGSGKTTIARALAAHLKATHLRIDSIEQALLRSGEMPAPPQVAGYLVAYAVAEDCLRAGATVIADSVNPIAATRKAWLDVARRAERPSLQVEIRCSDPVEHRRRVEARLPDIDGHIQPTWQEVVDRQFEPWAPDALVDTTQATTEQAVRIILACLPHHKN